MSDWTLVHGDALREAWPDAAVMLTDPPYSEHVHTHLRTAAKGNDIREDVRLDFAPASALLMMVVGQRAAAHVAQWSLLFSDWESDYLWRDAMALAGLENVRTGCWTKPDCTPQITGDRPGQGAEAILIAHPRGKKRWNGRGSAAWWNHPCRERGVTRVHPTQKPLALLERLVDLFTDPGDLIVDPFAGSGAVGVAAIRRGRRYFGFELDADYHDAASSWLSRTREPLRLFDTYATTPKRRPHQGRLV